MKYPRYNNRPLTADEKREFSQLLKRAKESINFDNGEFLGKKLSKKDVDLMAWNVTTMLYFFSRSKKRNLTTINKEELPAWIKERL
jgi:hypothetical protein